MPYNLPSLVTVIMCVESSTVNTTVPLCPCPFWWRWAAAGVDDVVLICALATSILPCTTVRKLLKS